MKFGWLMACAFSVVAIVGALVGSCIYLVRGGASGFAHWAELVRLIWVIPAYFLGFIVAGALYSPVSHVSNRIARYSLAGATVGTSVYGAVGLVSGFIDGKPQSWGEYRTAIVGLGALCTLLGLAMGILDTIRERRRPRPAELTPE